RARPRRGGAARPAGAGAGAARARRRRGAALLHEQRARCLRRLGTPAALGEQQEAVRLVASWPVSRVLPIPASPPTSATTGSPPAAPASRARRPPPSRAPPPNPPAATRQPRTASIPRRACTRPGPDLATLRQRH